MELEETEKSEYSTYENEDDKYYSDLQLDDLPDLVEFEISENIVELLENKSHLSATKEAPLENPSGFTPDNEDEETLKRFVFTCKVCKKTFPTLKSCERHIICRGHTYPLIGLVSSDTMNGETFDRIIMPNSLQDEREFKTVPSSDFIPIYMGKWSKVICELRHRFGQDSDYVDGAHLKDHAPHSSERYNQPDVTQTQPKALEVSPHGEIVRAMKKLEECFQTKSSPIIHSWGVRDEISRADSPERTTNGDLENDFPNDIDAETTENTPNGNESINESCQNGDLINLEPYHDAETFPRGRKYKSIEHKIYVDFSSESLVCEGCCNNFDTLNEAINHWKTLRISDVKKHKDTEACERSESPTNNTANQRCHSETVSEVHRSQIPDDIQETGNPSPEEPSETKPGDDESDDKYEESDEVREGAYEADEKSPNEWDPKEEFDGSRDDDDDRASGKDMSFTPFKEKQNGGGSFYDTSFIREEKEQLMKEEKMSKKNKKDKKGKKKRKKKNKPLKYIRRAFMMTVMFLF